MIISPETLCGGVAVAGPGAGVGGAVCGGEEAGVAAGVAAVDRRQPAVALLALLHHAVAAETRTGDRLHQIFLCPNTTTLTLGHLRYSSRLLSVKQPGLCWLSWAIFLFISSRLHGENWRFCSEVPLADMM